MNPTKHDTPLPLMSSDDLAMDGCVDAIFIMNGCETGDDGKILRLA